MHYVVRRAQQPVAADADWDKPAWASIDAIELTQFMGPRPAHFPRTLARLQYDDDAIYVIFRVEDRYVLATARAHQDPVCQDSCVEFFFTPGEHVDGGYFNLEVNAGGTMLFRHQVIPRRDPRPIAGDVLRRIRIATTLPRLVEPEIAEPTVWVAEYRLPTDFLREVDPQARRPARGTRWRANLFKCADASSHPHWLTWSPVNRPEPDFHVPDCFGTIEFE